MEYTATIELAGVTLRELEAENLQDLNNLIVDFVHDFNVLCKKTYKVEAKYLVVDKFETEKKVTFFDQMRITTYKQLPNYKVIILKGAIQKSTELMKESECLNYVNRIFEKNSYSDIVKNNYKNIWNFKDDLGFDTQIKIIKVDDNDDNNY